jgi:ketosteroid isomerase-like protein
MEKAISVLILLTMVLLPLMAQVAARQNTAREAEVRQTEEDKRTEEEVRKLNADEGQAFLDRDPKALERLWSDDLVVTNPLNKFVNKQQVLGMVESGFLVIASYDRRIEYLHVYGDTVIVAGSETVLWGGKMPNAGKTEHLRFTGIWMKQRGRWQEIARHANIVPPQ